MEYAQTLIHFVVRSQQELFPKAGAFADKEHPNGPNVKRDEAAADGVAFDVDIRVDLIRVSALLLKRPI
jgi:hypothetical protein